jgi:hypothetical protein
MMTSALDRVTGALTAAGCYERSGNWTCPVHEDREPSLHVTSDHRGAGLKCHAGCDAKDIVNVLGLEWDDLFEEPLRETERYPYRYDGKLFEKIRLSAPGRKTFRWEPALNGHRMPLYRAQEALALPGPVYVIESEKDVNTLLDMGVAATCMPGGAGTWYGEYSEALGGRNVIIIADRDDAGVKHARKVQASLKGKAFTAKIMQSRTANDHDDIGDHLKAGFALNEMVPLSLAGGRPYRTVSLAETSRRGVQPPVLLCGGFLYAGGLHSIAGAPDSGKTSLSLFWAAQLLREGKNVLFLDEEGGPEITVEKMEALGATHEDLEFMSYIPFPGRSWDDDDIGELMSFTKEIDPAMMLVDSSAAFLARAGLDENSAPAVTSWWSKVLTPIARDIGAAVLVIDHDTKSSEASRYARGSGAKLAALDVQLKVTMTTPFTREQDGNLKINIPKDRRGWLHRNWNVDVHTGNGIIQPEFTRETPDNTPVTQISGAPGKRSIYAVLDDIPKTYHEINELVHEKDGFYLKRTTVSQYLNELLKDGLVEKLDGRGRENEWIRKMSKDSTSDVAYSASDVDHSAADVEYPWEPPF